MIDECDKAWAAGFFDGEGTTCAHEERARQSGHRPKRLRLSIGQKDPIVLYSFAQAVGVGKVRGPYTTGNRYTFTASGREAAKALKVIWPYLSTIKRRQALDALAAIKARREIEGMTDARR